MRHAMVFRLCCALALAALAVPASAQPGGTGGSLGKTGKSVSGGAREAPQRPSPPAGGRPASPCGKIPGLWSWFINGDVTFRADGTLVQGGLTGRWTCAANGAVTIVWSHGFTDSLLISQDGRRMAGKNQWGFGVSGKRKN